MQGDEYKWKDAPVGVCLLESVWACGVNGRCVMATKKVLGSLFPYRNYIVFKCFHFWSREHRLLVKFSYKYQLLGSTDAFVDEKVS